MRVVLDTNVLVSGIFFARVPGWILDAWGEGRFALCATPSIFAAYGAVCRRPHVRFLRTGFEGVLGSILRGAPMIPDPAPGPRSRAIWMTTSSSGAPWRAEAS